MSIDVDVKIIAGNERNRIRRRVRPRLEIRLGRVCWFEVHETAGLKPALRKAVGLRSTN
jgi:hypothetical protein